MAQAEAWVAATWVETAESRVPAAEGRAARVVDPEAVEEVETVAQAAEAAVAADVVGLDSEGETAVTEVMGTVHS